GWNRYWNSYNPRLDLVETSPGVYTVDWTATGRWNSTSSSGENVIWLNYPYQIFVYDGAGNQSSTTGQIVVNGVNSVSASPSQFSTYAGGSTTVTVQAATGLNLELRVLSGTTLVKTLPLTETTAGVFTTQWDGKDQSGTAVTLG